jgi:hypothetical protein
MKCFTKPKYVFSVPARTPADSFVRAPARPLAALTKVWFGYLRDVGLIILSVTLETFCIRSMDI